VGSLSLRLRNSVSVLPSASERNYETSALPYQTLAHKPPQVAPKFANGERHRGVQRRADLRRLVRILNKVSPNLLGLSRREAGSAMTSARFRVRLQKRTRSSSRNERRRGDAMKRIHSEMYEVLQVHIETPLTCLFFCTARTPLRASRA